MMKRNCTNAVWLGISVAYPKVFFILFFFSFFSLVLNFSMEAVTLPQPAVRSDSLFLTSPL